MLKKYDVILFDADRTLFDTSAMETLALQRIVAGLNVPYEESMAETYYTINEALWRRIELGELTREFVRVERFRRFLERYGIEADAEEMNRQYMENFQVGNVLIHDAERVCRELAKEKTLAVITNGTASVQKVRFGLVPITPYFKEIFISEEVGIPKPHKAFFDAVMNGLGISDRSRVLIIGDSLTSDIKGGNNAGIDACWFNPDGQTNDTDAYFRYEIKALGELLTME